MSLPRSLPRSLQFRPLHADFGAEATGFDLTHPLTPAQVQAMDSAMDRYGVFGQGYVRAFADRWLQRPSGQSLGSADIQSLNDLGGSYSVIREMRIVPFPSKFVGETVVIALAPILPLYLQTVSVATIAAYLVKAIF